MQNSRQTQILNLSNSSDDHFVKEELLNKSWFNEGGASEPNGGKGQNCVYAFARNLKWFDFRCSRSRVYSICELPITTPIIGKGAEQKVIN